MRPIASHVYKFTPQPARIRCLALLLAVGYYSLAGDEDRKSLLYGKDPNIKIVMKGRGGNLELASSGVVREGYTVTDFQKGRGYVEYDRERQVLKWQTKIGYTLNRFSKHIKKVAPYMRAHIPKDAELDFQLDITNLGYGSLDFGDMNISRFKLDVNYGDVDIDFSTENMSIIRGTAKFHLMAGDLEIENLGNLKAGKVFINGGVGELTVDFGPRLFQDMSVTLDHDIGTMELILPKGTRVVISGTSRDLSSYGFEKKDKKWRPSSYHQNSPILNIKMRGPMGDLTIIWK